MSLRSFILLFAVVLAFDLNVAYAEVVRVQIDRREPFAPGADFGTVGRYERLTGRIFLDVDPRDPANGKIVDLSLAPRNNGGRVEFWTDFCLLKPVDMTRGNRRLLYDVNNRGNKLALGFFNNQGGNNPTSDSDAGNGFLMRKGYSVLWCGWNGDVLPGDERLLIGLPVATENGTPITGRVHAEITVNSPSFSQPLYWGNSKVYPTAIPNGADAVLTMRARRAEAPVEIPRDGWSFARNENGREIPDARQLFLKEGFRPGWLYDLVYTARDPRVTGLGFAAVRDVVSFFRHAKGDQQRVNPVAGGIEKTIVFGVSQSGRFIHHFLWQGFNADVDGHIVFDGAMPHVAGGGKGYFNHRFAQTTRHGSQHEDNLSPSEMFPFTTTRQVDPHTGEAGDTLELARRSRCVPKIIFTQTSTEYWCRGASLLHTDVDGTVDVPVDDNVRLYVICGAQHGNTRSTERGDFQNLPNTLDHRPLLRASLVALDEWISHDKTPPPNLHPTISSGTLVDFATWKHQMPRRMSFPLPTDYYVPNRLDFGPRWLSEGIADIVPPKVTGRYQTLLPAVDADGNEVGGVRLPDVAVPLGIYTGWNLRTENAGAAGSLGRWAGSFESFARRAEERAEDDRRPSIEERYPSKDAFLSARRQAIQDLVQRRLVLAEDAQPLLLEASSSWDAVWSNR